MNRPRMHEDERGFLGRANSWNATVFCMIFWDSLVAAAVTQRANGCPIVFTNETLTLGCDGLEPETWLGAIRAKHFVNRALRLRGMTCRCGQRTPSRHGVEHRQFRG